MLVYLVAFVVGCLGFWLLQLGMRPRSAKQKMKEAMTTNLEWQNSKEKSYRIYFGIALLIASLIMFLK